jgi:putative peptidoglycan lipid II flippase
VSPPPAPQGKAEPTGVAQAASIIALGNIASRLLGLVRVQIISHLFGASGLVSVFHVAAAVPMMIYDLLIGGMLSAALVPVFSQVAEREGRLALWAAFSRVASLVAVILASLVLFLEILAPQVAWLLGGGFDPELQQALADMIRIIAPATLFFGLSGVVTSLLYTLKRFTFPAFGAAVYNLGIIVIAPLLAGRLDAFSLALGVLVGALLQLTIQLPDLRDARLRFVLDLSHPVLRRILVLYLPIALGLIVSNAQIAIDRRLASSTGESSIAWMANATTLIQMPHGLVAVAISLAVLPTLSRMNAAGDHAGFRRTLGQGLRLVLILIVPATLGLLVLARPAIALLFEHGRFTALDTYWTAWALRLYLLGLVFAAVDWPLNYAFYARQDTLTPALVGVLSVAVYLGVALPLLRPLGMLGLVLADSAKHMSHAVTMLVLARWRLGGLKEMRLGQTLGKALLASSVMAGLMALALAALARLLGTEGLGVELISVGVVGTLGLLSYLGAASLLQVKEIGLLADLLRRRLGRSEA